MLRNYSRSHPDSMHVYAFNGNFDSLLVFMAPYGYGNTSSNENIVAFGTMLPNNTVQFYSSVIHNHNHLLLPENIEYPMTYVNGNLPLSIISPFMESMMPIQRYLFGDMQQTKIPVRHQCNFFIKNGNQFSAYSSYTGKFHELTRLRVRMTYMPVRYWFVSQFGPEKGIRIHGLTGDYVPLTDLTLMYSIQYGWLNSACSCRETMSGPFPPCTPPFQYLPQSLSMAGGSFFGKLSQSIFGSNHCHLYCSQSRKGASDGH